MCDCIIIKHRHGTEYSVHIQKESALDFGMGIGELRRISLSSISFSRLLLRLLERSVMDSCWSFFLVLYIEKRGKVHPCTGTEALYRPYAP